MRSAPAIFCAIFVAACATAPRPVPNVIARYAAAGPHAIASGDAEWRDTTRNVVIRARIYYPIDAGPHPVIVFSHGLGNSRFGYRYLGEHWASWGLISVHIEHPGAGEDLARRGWLALYRAGFDRRLWTSTPADVHFILDRLLSADAPPFLSGRIDRGAIGVAGHSLGAYVALAAAGAIARLPDANAVLLRDPRIRAAAALSMSENLSPTAYGGTDVPILHLTGTSDSSLFYGTTKRMRRIPFQSIAGAPQLLATIAGANHSTFSADERAPRAERTDLIKALTLLWWQAWLQNDRAAQTMLFDPAFATGLTSFTTIETKNR